MDEESFDNTAQNLLALKDWDNISQIGDFFSHFT